jgi:hypothetical protein
MPDGRSGWVAADLTILPLISLPTPATIPPSPIPTATVRLTATWTPAPTNTPEKEALPGQTPKGTIPPPRP